MSTIVFVGLMIWLAYYLSMPVKPKKKSKTKAPPKQNNVTPLDRGQMLRCHECSCFFSNQAGVHVIVEGHNLHFCSPGCRDKFKVS